MGMPIYMGSWGKFCHKNFVQGGFLTAPPSKKYKKNRISGLPPTPKSSKRKPSFAFLKLGWHFCHINVAFTCLCHENVAFTHFFLNKSLNFYPYLSPSNARIFAQKELIFCTPFFSKNEPVSKIVSNGSGVSIMTIEKKTPASVTFDL